MSQRKQTSGKWRTLAHWVEYIQLSFFSCIYFEFIFRYLQNLVKIWVSKVGDWGRRRPEGSIFYSYYIKVYVGLYSFPWIAPLYPWYLPYNAECNAKRYQVPFSESLIWINLGLNSSLPVHKRTCYPFGQQLFLWTFFSSLFPNIVKYHCYFFLNYFSYHTYLFSVHISFYLLLFKTFSKPTLHFQHPIFIVSLSECQHSCWPYAPPSACLSLPPYYHLIV